MNHTSHKDWANSDNSILVDPSGKETSEDGVFFNKNAPINQGNINSITEEEILESFERAEKSCKEYNKQGAKLKDEFTYDKTVDSILKIMSQKV